MNDSNSPYGSAFYSAINTGSGRSASVCVPIILEMISAQSVVDIGCGEGAWLAEFRRRGVQTVLGIDGDYVDPERLQIPRSCFRSQDLSKAFTVEGVFDVALCLEVGEHLPEHAADALVTKLIGSAPAVVFSAAVPGQGGVNHINEQWPWYWRTLFERHGWVCLDAIRPRIWQHVDVEPYYQQNLYLYVDPARHHELLEAYAASRDLSLTLVQSYILERRHDHTPTLWRRLWNRLTHQSAD